jgi:hypothetical protein
MESLSEEEDPLSEVGELEETGEGNASSSRGGVPLRDRELAAAERPGESATVGEVAENGEDEGEDESLDTRLLLLRRTALGLFRTREVTEGLDA